MENGNHYEENDEYEGALEEGETDFVGGEDSDLSFPSIELKTSSGLDGKTETAKGKKPKYGAYKTMGNYSFYVDYM